MADTLGRRALGEALGTGLLVTAVVGSGIMAERLSAGNMALALLANTIATGAALLALILTFGPLSGAHFNPAVSLSMALTRRIPFLDVSAYIGAQLGGAVLGTLLAHVMFAVPLVTLSHHQRAGLPQLVAEFVATFGLLVVIFGCLRAKTSVAGIALAVAAYITSAYWFTSSTSFANPAVTIARSLTDTFSGIRPADVPGFVAAQILGALAATVFCSWLLPAKTV
jgi:glycerol uptake facilitator-like aquaporin